MSENITWTIEKIKEGFDKFFKENNRMPTAEEIDGLDYLPSSRQIQRRFGGLVKLREELGYKDTDFSKGENRSNIAFKIGKRGLEKELEMEYHLTKHFGEVFVHIQKRIDNIYFDFWVYSPDEIFGVDIFYPDSKQSLSKIVNYKGKLYDEVKNNVYFVVANTEYAQELLDELLSNKKFPIKDNLKLYSWNSFLEKIDKMSVFNNPIKSNPSLL